MDAMTSQTSLASSDWASRSSALLTSSPPPVMRSWTSPTSGYTFPPIWSFPPFFTEQPNPTTRQHQLELWSSLLLSFATHRRLFSIALSSADSPNPPEVIFNRAANRRILGPFLAVLLDHLVKSGHATPDPPLKSPKDALTGVILLWKRPDEWAALIYDWVSSTGQTNSILTFYDLQSDESTPFHDLPLPLLRSALAVLAKQGKAQVFRGTVGEDGQPEGEGVKFV